MLNLIIGGWRFLAVGFVVGALTSGVGVWWLRDQMAAHSEVRQAREVVRTIVRQGAVTTRVETRYVARAAEVRTVTRTITREIPHVLPVEVDQRFPLPNGFVRLHDAAALGTVPDTASVPDGAASDVTASEAASVIVDNYGTYYQTREQLLALQDWIRQQQDPPH